jgi:hypothetical protein
MQYCDEFVRHIKWMAGQGVSAQRIGEVFGYSKEQMRKVIVSRPYLKAQPLWTLEALVRQEVFAQGVK